MHVAVVPAHCAERIEAVQEVVGGCEVMLLKEVVTQVQSGDGGKVRSLFHVGNADERHLVIGVSLGYLATYNVPEVGVHRLAEDAAAVQLRDDGESAIAWSNVSLYGIPYILCGIGTACQVEVDVPCECRLNAATGEIGVVEVVVTELDKGAEQMVGAELGDGRQVGNDGVVGIAQQAGFVIGSGSIGNADGTVDVEQMELRHIGANLVLHIVDAGDVTVEAMELEVLAAIVIGQLERGEVKA